jgi:hypothetical protein
MQQNLFFIHQFPLRSAFSTHAVAIFISVIGLTINSASYATSWETSTMRAPGGGMVRIGMTRQEVLSELGQPQRTHTSTHNTTVIGKSARRGSSLTYRGDDGLYTITFSGDQVVKIVVTPKRD